METPANPEERSTPLPAAISTIAVAQICYSVGYTTAEPAALRALSDIATRYIQSIGQTSSAAANIHSRTDCNLFDLARALEELAAVRGFAGGSDPTRPLLKSRILRELMAFVRSVDEIPFAKPLPRRRKTAATQRSFAEMEKEPPLKHVPRWLPCFPESWEGWLREEKREQCKEEKHEVVVEVVNGGLGREKRKERERDLDLPEVRERVRFRLGSVEKKMRVAGRGTGDLIF